MALDKLVDSTQLDADLTSVANAIRTKGGTSAALAFPDGFVDAIDAIETGGGGSTTAATGEFTLTSDFSLTTSAQVMPGLQLPFQPDFLYFIASYDSWVERDTFGAGIWGLLAIRKSLVAPFRIASNVSTDAIDGDYLFVLNQNVAADTSVSNGHAINGFSPLGQSYYSRYSVNSDGTISVGRFSTASTKMYTGTYRYFAIKT